MKSGRIEREAAGGGSPWICYRLAGPRSSFVEWGDGSVRLYRQFGQSLDKEALGEALEAAFYAAAPRLTTQTVLVSGGVHGSLSKAPPDLAEQVLGIVVRHFDDALSRLAQQVAMEQRASAPVAAGFPWAAA